MRIPAGQFTSFLGLAPSARRTRHRGGYPRECSDHLHTIIRAGEPQRRRNRRRMFLNSAAERKPTREIVASPFLLSSFFLFLLLPLVRRDAGSRSEYG